MYNIRDKVIKAFEDELFPFKGGFQEKESDVLNKKLANWVRIDENFFNQIKDQVKRLRIKIYTSDQIVVPILILMIHFNELIRDIEYVKLLMKKY